MSESPDVLDATEAASSSSQFLTAPIQGTGGRIKAAPEDFIVDEVPAYEPSGNGEHLYLLIEKKGATTGRAIEWLSSHFQAPRGAFGYAGMKDREAVTRQWISIHDPLGKIDENEAEQTETEWLRVLEATRHGNKLRLGHLRGNRFRIRIRDVGIGAAPRALRVLRALERHGAPNFFGPQRYGTRGVNHLIGRAIICGRYDEAVHEILAITSPEDEARQDATARRRFMAGDFAGAMKEFPRSAHAEHKILAALKKGADAEGALRSVSHVERNFWLSGFQSAVFDEILCERMKRRLMDEILPGDVAIKHDNGALFDVTNQSEVDELRGRIDDLEVSPTGALWGPAMKMPQGEVRRIEETALNRAGVTIDDLAKFAELWDEMGMGTRRALRLKLSDPGIEAGADERGEYIECCFELPAGSFATVVMNEVMKNQAQVRRPW